MCAMDLIRRLGDEANSLPEIIAPVLEEGKTVVKVLVNDHPYRFEVAAPKAGWYVLKPLSALQARVVREAFPAEAATCLKAVPSLRLIAMRRVTESRWLAFPFNKSEAAAKGFDLAPYEVFLIDTNLEPFSVILARAWGGTLLFDSYAAPPIAEYTAQLEQGRDAPPQVKGYNPEYKIVYSLLTDEIKQAKQRTVAGRIQSAVEYLGATLVGYKEFGDGYEVTYRDGTETYRARISNGLRLESAGICLSGLERQQTLASCVAVMRKRPTHWGQHFYDNEEEDYDD